MIGVLALLALCYILYYIMREGEKQSDRTLQDWRDEVDEKHDL